MDYIVTFVVGVIIGICLFSVLAKPDVTGEQIMWATSVCETNGGISSVEDWYTDNSRQWVYAKCNNGAVFGYKEKK